MTSPTTGTPDATRIRGTVQPRRRWLWIVSFLVALVAIAFYFAPAWVARHVHEAGVTLGDDSGQAFSLHAEKVSLGWFSPAKLNDVSIRDEQGHSFLRAESVVSERPLMRLVMDRLRPGRFTIRKPYLDVRVREDGSNLEDLIQTLLSRPRSKRELSQGAIAISDGRIDFHDPQGTLLGTVESIELTASHRRESERKIEFELTADIVQDGERKSLQAAADWRGPRHGLPFLSGLGTAALKFDPVSLRAAQPYLTRVRPDVMIHTGSVSGQLLVECDMTDKHAISATGQVTTTDVHITTGSGTRQPKAYRWEDEELAMQIDGTFDPEADVIDFSQAKLQSTPIEVAAAGQISNVHGESQVDLSGHLQYDVSPLVNSLQTQYGQHVQITGLQTRSIRIVGPVARLVNGRPRWDVSRLSLEADLGWTLADVFGVRSEQASVVAQVRNGMLLIDPRDVPVSGGQFTASPRFTFFDGRPVAHIPNGPALQSVEMTPEMCRLWLKYLSPPLADATRINGRFSIDFEDGQVPLNSISDGHLRGLFHVHAADVRPGAFAVKVIGIVGTIQELIGGKRGWSHSVNSRLIAMDDQRIPFVMEAGRVHHEQLEFLVAGTAVQTSGSVGFDDSLDLLITIPLPESWLTKDDLRGMLGDEAIRIPVRGTLDRPQFDLLPLRQLAQRLAVRATSGLLQKLLD